MYRLVELIFLAAVVLFAITDVFVPLVTDSKLFPTFRRKKVVDVPKPDNSTLEAKIDVAKAKVAEVKEVQKEVQKEFEKTKDLKDKSDNLMK